MTKDATDAQGSFFLPARTLKGSRREMLEDIDQAIVGLLALRHLIDGTNPPQESLARRSDRQGARRRWPRWLAVLRPLAFGKEAGGASRMG